MNPLDQLRDIQLPDPVSWWPPAPGWWVLGFLVLAVLVWALHWWRGHYRRYAFRRQALQELETLRRQQTLALPALLRLARRTALSAGKKNLDIASTSSNNLLNLIINSSRLPESKRLDAEQLATRLYQPSPLPLNEEESKALCNCTRAWIKQFKGGLPC